MLCSRPGLHTESLVDMAPRRATACFLLAALVCAATATVFLEEKFDDGAHRPGSRCAPEARAVGVSW